MADSAVRSLRDAIDEKIAGSAPAVREAAIEHFASIEHKRRADVLVAAVTAHRELEADLRKVNRADQVFFGEDGAQTVAHFSKGRLNDIKKLKDKSAKLEAAINKVLDADRPSTDDYAKLEKAIKAAKSKDAGKPDAEGEAEADED